MSHDPVVNPNQLNPGHRRLRQGDVQTPRRRIGRVHHSSRRRPHSGTYSLDRLIIIYIFSSHNGTALAKWTLFVLSN